MHSISVMQPQEQSYILLLNCHILSYASASACDITILYMPVKPACEVICNMHYDMPMLDAYCQHIP